MGQLLENTRLARRKGLARDLSRLVVQESTACFNRDFSFSLPHTQFVESDTIGLVVAIFLFRVAQ